MRSALTLLQLQEKFDDSGESDGGSDNEDLDENSDQDTDIEDVLAQHSYNKFSKK